MIKKLLAILNGESQALVSSEKLDLYFYNVQNILFYMYFSRFNGGLQLSHTRVFRELEVE